MSSTHLFAGIPVADFGAARAWYAVLFGRPPDMLPTQGEAVWHVTASGSVYVVASPARAGGAVVTIAVADLDEHAAALGRRGLSPDVQPAGPGVPRRVRITDADGNRITFFADPAQQTG